MSITPYVPPTTLSSLPSAIWSGVDGLAVLPFLPGQAVNVSKAPMWSTEVIRTASGRERRTSYWPFPLWQFELSYAVVRHKPTQDELVTMLEFFNVMAGQFAPFLFVDPSDCQILSTAPVGFATGDGSTKTFKLLHAYNSFSDQVYGAYTPTILDNGSAAGAHTVANGYVTFTTAPASGHALTWYGYFYFGCRFLQDDLTFEQIVNLLWSGKSLKLTSLRAP